MMKTKRMMKKAVAFLSVIFMMSGCVQAIPVTGAEPAVPAATPTPTVMSPATDTPAGIVQTAAVATTLPPVPPLMIDPTFPIRAVFYFTWYPPASRHSTVTPSFPYNPQPDLAGQNSPALIRQQIAAMQYGKIELGIASWWGQGHYTDEQVPALLSAGEATGFHWALFDETEDNGDPSVLSIRSDLEYISTKYANSPAYLKIDGHFVVFVYSDTNDRCGMVDRWYAANATVGAYLVMRVYPGHQRCDYQPTWYQYAPAVAEYSEGQDSFTISPGFWNSDEAQPRLERDLARWDMEIQQMVASNANFQLVSTFNEWAQGTAIENEGRWLSPSGYGLYLDALHHDGIPQDTSSAGTSPNQ